MTVKLTEQRNFGGYINLLELDCCIISDSCRKRIAHTKLHRKKDNQERTVRNSHFPFCKKTDKLVP